MSKFKEMLNNPLPSKNQVPILEIKISDYIDGNDFLVTEDNFIPGGKYGEYFHLSQQIQHGIISVYSNEATNPHFHIRSFDAGFREVCIRLDDNRYFNHGYKTGTLDNGELRELIKF